MGRYGCKMQTDCQAILLRLRLDVTLQNPGPNPVHQTFLEMGPSSSLLPFVTLRLHLLKCSMVHQLVWLSVACLLQVN